MLPLLSGLVLATPPSDPPDRGRLAIYAARTFEDGDDPRAEVGVEWRFPDWPARLHPILGATWIDGGGGYAYGGLRYEIPLTDRLGLAPSFSLGFFDVGDVDLGHVVEFRSAIELTYEIEDGFSIGVGYNHISNAGLSDRNPGLDSLMLGITIEPMRWFE